jgi:hypothetical protein
MFSLHSGRLCTWYVVSERRELIVAGEEKGQELRDKRQELRGIKEELQSDQTSREEKRALREKRKQLRGEIHRLKDGGAEE